MKFARIESSPRLKRLGRVLLPGQYLTTLDLIKRARIAAVSAAVSELRAQGWSISCRVEMRRSGRVFAYRADRVPKCHAEML